MIRCAIVDDEELARCNLEAMLEPAADIEIVGSYGRARDALDRLIADPPDVVFLDIKMPEISGMAILEELSRALGDDRRPYVVLVTAFDRFALQAFQYDALDYLVKPVASERFAASLDRARERIRQRRALAQPGTSGSARTDSAARAQADHSSGQPGGRQPAERWLTYKVSGGIIRVCPADLVWVEAVDHYVVLHADQRSHLVRATMAAFERELEPYGFVRVHRGALVHPHHVVSSETLRDGGRQLTLRDGSRVRVSRRRWRDVAGSLFPADPPNR